MAHASTCMVGRSRACAADVRYGDIYAASCPPRGTLLDYRLNLSDDLRSMALDEQMFYRAVGARLREARLNAPGGRMSQSSLADAIGLPRTSIGKIESGDHGLPLYKFIMICGVLGVSPQFILPSDVFNGQAGGPVGPFTSSEELPDSVKSVVESLLHSANEPE